MPGTTQTFLAPAELATLLGLDESLLDLWGQLDEPLRLATALVLLCHAGHGWDLRGNRRLALRWWSEFLPERVTLAALTSGSLAEFTAELCRRLRGTVGDRYDAALGAAQREAWRRLLALPEGRQRHVLDALEAQASVCVTLVRAHADARRRQRQEVTDGAAAESDG